jgi:propionate CoA-transferase
VRYITERCVFELASGGIELVEVAPGVDVQRDILDQMDFEPLIPEEPKLMERGIFRSETMNLRQRPLLSLDERVTYRSEDDLLYLNFEGLRLDSAADAAELAQFLDERLAQYGRKLNVIVNYDNFSLAPAAADRYWEMIRHNTATYFLSLTRYSTNAFFRHQLREAFAGEHLTQQIYRSFADAKRHLADPQARYLSRVAGAQRPD